jgi:hypothetical protein
MACHLPYFHIFAPVLMVAEMWLAGMGDGSLLNALYLYSLFLLPFLNGCCNVAGWETAACVAGIRLVFSCRFIQMLLNFELSFSRLSTVRPGHVIPHFFSLFCLLESISSLFFAFFWIFSVFRLWTEKIPIF